MSYTFSKTWKSDGVKTQETRDLVSKKSWVSDRTKEQERFRRVLPNLKRMYYEGVTDVPWTFEDWIHFRAEAVPAKQLALLRKLEARRQERMELALLKEHTGQSHLRLFGGATQRPAGLAPWPDRGAVLCERTVWCEDWGLPHRSSAMSWPDYGELKFEGDDRVASTQWPDYRRCLPLPRFKEPGKETAAWSMRPRLMQHDFDEVYRKKTAEDIYFPIEDVADEIGEDLVGSEMMKAIEGE